MITTEKLNAAMEGYSVKLKILNDCINEEMKLPFHRRRMKYMAFLAKERAIYEFTSNELKKLSQ